MRDFWTFRPTEVLENKKHLFECKDSKSDSGHSLLVHVAATHAGIVNGNMRFYRPDKMQEGVHTWLPESTKDGVTLRTPRPVLVGHDEKGDVLGRVLEAKYVDDSWRVAGEFPIVKDFLFYQRDGKKRQNLFNSVDWIVDNLMPLREYTGLGYTDLGLRITNPDAIRKVLADEYLTVSVGFKTDAAICSICHTNWAEDGKCEHKVGQVVDGQQQFLITGCFVNQELSFINFAADPFATTVGKKVLTDSLEKIFFLGLPIQAQRDLATAGMRMTDGLYESDIAATEGLMDTNITLDPIKLREEIKSEGLMKDRAQELRALLGTWQPEADELKTERRSLISTLNSKVRKNGWDKNETVQDAQTETDAAVAAELAAFVAQDVKKKAKCEGCGEEFEADKLNVSTYDGSCWCDECQEKFADGKDGKKPSKKKKKKEGEEEEVVPAANGQSGKKVSKKSAEKAKEFQQKEIAGADPAVENEDACGLEGECRWKGYEFTDEEKTYFSDVDGINEELELELDAAVTDGELPAELVKDAKLSSEARGNLPKGAFCGPNGSFPVPDCAHVTAARRLIGRAKVSDSTKSKILACVSSKAKTLKCSTGNAKDALQSDNTSGFSDELRDLAILVKCMDAAEAADPEKAAEIKEILGHYDCLDKHHKKAGGDTNGLQYKIEDLHSAIGERWNKDRYVEWAKEYLAKHVKDMVLVATSEVAEKDEALNGLMAEKDALTAEVDALKNSRQSVLATSKRTLAQQIVMHGMLTGQDAFKDLTTDKVAEKVSELAKRHISSLKDSVSDILNGLRWTEHKDSASTATEHEKPVSDNTRLTDDAPVGTSANDKAKADAQEQALQDSIQLRLRYMSVTERNRFLARLSYDTANTK